jgi:hypothetical protein
MVTEFCESDISDDEVETNDSESSRAPSQMLQFRTIMQVYKDGLIQRSSQDNEWNQLGCGLSDAKIEEQPTIFTTNNHVESSVVSCLRKAAFDDTSNNNQCNNLHSKRQGNTSTKIDAVSTSYTKHLKPLRTSNSYVRPKSSASVVRVPNTRDMEYNVKREHFNIKNSTTDIDKYVETPLTQWITQTQSDLVRISLFAYYTHTSNMFFVLFSVYLSLFFCVSLVTVLTWFFIIFLYISELQCVDARLL